jgi:ornithine decarboxylase
MKELKIATSASLVAAIETLRQIVRVEQTDLYRRCGIGRVG